LKIRGDGEEAEPFDINYFNNIVCLRSCSDQNLPKVIDENEKNNSEESKNNHPESCKNLLYFSNSSPTFNQFNYNDQESLNNSNLFQENNNKFNTFITKPVNNMDDYNSDYCLMKKKKKSLH